MSRTTTAAAFALALVALPTALLAQPDGRRDFDRLIRSATAHYEAHQSREAIQDLERAYAIRPIPRLLYNLGRAYEQAEDYTTAADYYRRFVQSNPGGEELSVAQEALRTAERRAEQQAEDRRRRQEAAAAAERDRALAEAQARAAEAERQRIADAERQRQLREAARVRPRRVTTPMVVAWGVGGAALIAGGVMGGLSLAARSDFDASRMGQDRYDSYTRGTAMTLGADISFGVALAAGLTSLVLYLIQPTTAPPTETTP